MVSDRQKSWLERLGKTLQAMRKAKNISQDDLAKRSGISRRTLVSLEKGEGCTLDTFLSVMDGLGEYDPLEDWLSALSRDMPLEKEGKSAQRKRHFRAAARPVNPLQKEESNPWILQR